MIIILSQIFSWSLTTSTAYVLIDHNTQAYSTFKHKNLTLKLTVVNWMAYYLKDRYRRVKLNSDCFSDFKPVPAGIPQGTRIGPWLFLVMISDLTISNTLSSIMEIRRRHHGLGNCPQVWCINAPRYSTWCNAFKIVKSAKILGVTIRNDLKWDYHTGNITANADRQIYCLSNLSALA